MHKFRKNIIDIYEEQGRQWLASLPKLLTTLAYQYSLTDLKPVDNMTFNYVVSAIQEDKSVILKLGLNKKALAREAACLKAFKNHGAVNLIAFDDGMILMECAKPGITLSTLFSNDDHQATAILCHVIQQLHQSNKSYASNFIPLSNLLAISDNDLNIPLPILSKAQSLRDALINSTTKTVLLHGDLHHNNILKHGDQWRVIDPQGFIGDPVFDVCAFIQNPIPQLLDHANAFELINDRIQICADHLDFSIQRIRDWLFVKTVLCWAWCLEDNLDPAYFKTFLMLIDK